MGIKKYDVIIIIKMNTNFPLIIFDLICLPITFFKLILIYLFGSKYNIPGMDFIDVMFHANNPYFNQENNNTIDIKNEDIRAVIKRETKIYIEDDIKTYVKKTDTNINDDDINEDDINDDSTSESEESINSKSEEDIENDVIYSEDVEIDDDINRKINYTQVGTETSEINYRSDNKHVKVKLNKYVNKLFEDLENDVTTMTQSTHN